MRLSFFHKKYLLSVLVLVFSFSVVLYIARAEDDSAPTEPVQGVHVVLAKSGPNTFVLEVGADRGIVDWLLFSAEDYLAAKRGSFQGLPTGGGENCAKKFRKELTFSEKAFPLRLTLQACRDGEKFTGWGREERTLGLTLYQPGEMSSEAGFGSRGFITPLLDERIPEAVKGCVRRAPDGQALLADWQRWTGNPNGILRYGFTLETREIINKCVWQYSDVENPFLYPSDGLPPIPDLSSLEVTYPVKELGNCSNEAACRAYCEKTDSTERIRACLSFARAHDLLSEEDITKGEKLADLLDRGGPGGCRSETACRSYCEDNAHIDACLDFAEQNGFLSGTELAEARKIQAALKAGKTLPGNCRDKKACEAYCTQPAHMRACIDFAKSAGLLSDAELAEVEKFLPYLEKGETPGKCASKEQCEAYCGGEEHFEECVAFGEKTGFISKEEAEMIKKSGGKTPGGCRSKEQCEAYCGTPSHMDECMNFAVQTGMFSAEEAEKMKKERMRSVIADIAHSLEACLARPCKEVAPCIQVLKKDVPATVGGGDELLPEGLDERMQAKMSSCVEEEISACIQKPCSEFFSCIQAVGGESGGEQKESAPNSALEAKIESCSKKPEQQEGSSLSGEYQPPAPSYPAPSAATAPESYPSYTPYPSNAGPSPTPYQFDCSPFASVPNCSYVGSPDSDNYKYCKQCFPDR